MKKQVSTVHALLGVVFTFLISPSISFAQLPSYVPTDGLVGYWPFNGNANDESGNGNNGVILGSTSSKDRNGFSNAALSFNGLDNLVRVPSSNSLKTIEQNNSISISAWMNIEGYPQSIFSIINKYDQETDEGWELLYHNRYGFSFSYQAYKNFNDSCFPPLSFNQWYNVITTFNGVSGNFKIYLDGLLICEGKSNNKFYDTRNGDLIFGYSPIGPDELSQGKLDDIAIWNRALSPEEVEKLYNDSKEYSCDLSDILNPAVDYGTVTDIDGNVYPTVKIGEQEWMADNLRTTRYQNGDTILHNIAGNNWVNLNAGAWIYFKNDESYNCPNGKLYNWYAADDQRNVCPVDWHLPTNSEWIELFNSLGGQKLAALKMKTSNGWTGGSNGTNESGFNSFESGFYVAESGGIFYGEHFAYWSKTAINDLLASRFWHQRAYGEGILSDFISKFWGNSIRCVKDRPGQCDLIEKVDPAIRTTATGGTITFNAEYNTPNATYQWQSNTASTGWSDIRPSAAYDGANTTKLTITSAMVSNHMQQLRLVASNSTCFDTSNVATVFITDTCFVTLTDTILTTVTDTLVIDVVLSSTTDPSGTSIKVYPNPTSSQLVIETGNASLLTGYTMTITNGAGATVWTDAISQPLYSLDLSGWGGKGLYYMTLTDAQGKVVTTRKIVLQ